SIGRPRFRVNAAPVAMRMGRTFPRFPPRAAHGENASGPDLRSGPLRFKEVYGRGRSASVVRALLFAEAVAGTGARLAVAALVAVARAAIPAAATSTSVAIPSA